jgi:hypothetical protein
MLKLRSTSSPVINGVSERGYVIVMLAGGLTSQRQGGVTRLMVWVLAVMGTVAEAARVGSWPGECPVSNKTETGMSRKKCNLLRVMKTRRCSKICGEQSQRNARIGTGKDAHC